MNKSAFSLIEVLVAMVIVSLITTTGMFSFKLAINQIDRQSSLSFDEAMRFSQIKNLFNAAYFYVEEKKDRFNNEHFYYEYLFNKDEKEITFVSNAPLYGKNLSLINLKIVNDKLIYKEEKIYSRKQDYKNPIFLDGAIEHILLNDIVNAKFSYEEPIDLPKDLTSNIPKIIKLEFLKDNKKLMYIFDTKYDFFHLKRYLAAKRIVQ